MGLTSAQLPQLAAELQADPKSLGYAAEIAARSYAGVASLCNGTYPGVGTVWRTDLSAAEILAALVESEVTSLTATQWTRVLTLLSPGAIDASQQRIRDQFAGIFAGKTATLANLTAAARRAAPSRAEELWGYGVAVAEQDVANALGGL